MDYNWINCSKVIKSEVNTLVTEWQKLLGENLLGIYLHGSLAAGGFNPERSDINMLVLTAQGIDTETKHKLVPLLLRLSRVPAPLNVDFVANDTLKAALNPFQQPLPSDLHYDEKLREHYSLELRSEDWQNWNSHPQDNADLALYLTVLHDYGICLYGQPIATALPTVPEPIFRETLIADLHIANDQHLRNPLTFVLNACRTMAYLRTGNFLSKKAGGTWGLTHLPEQYYDLIHQVLAIYQNERLGRPAGRAVLESFTTFVNQEIYATEK